MATRIIKFAFVLALVALLSACSTSKGGNSCINPNAPGCGGNGGNGGGNPDQTGLDPLGDAAPKHYLKDSAGNNTSMWVRLLEITPARRSVISGLSMCGGVCYTVKIKAEIGKDDVEPRRNANIGFDLSADCAKSDKILGGGSVAVGASAIIEAESFVRFDTTPAPKCLLVRGSHPRNDGETIRGSYPLILEYQYQK